jgi:LEA14-like dessication related protein
MFSIRAFIMIFLAINLVSCAGIRPEPPEVQLANLEITDVSLSHANLQATLKLFNPNNIALNIEGIKFSLFLNEIRIAKGQTAKTFLIPSEEIGEATIRLSSSFLDIFQLTRKLQNRAEVTFRIVGEVKIGGFGLFGATIPIEREGSLPLSGSLKQLRPDSRTSPPLGPLENQILRQ